jgi:2-hydroxy-6-oxonona-2,4-dienedioate hydrolase
MVARGELSLGRDTAVRYQLVEGSNRELAVVLLPGLFAGGWIWEDVWQSLVVTGLTTCRYVDPLALHSSVSNLDGLSHELAGILVELDLKKAVLCGNSLGSLIALLIARDYEDRVDSVVISGCPGVGDSVDLALGALRLDQGFAFKVADRLFYDRTCVSNEVIEDTFRAVSNRKTLLNVVRGLRAARDYDVTNTIAKSECPLLMIWGENDTVTPLGPWIETIRTITGISLKKIPRCGHSPMIERPKQFSLALLSFLAERTQREDAFSFAMPGSVAP